MNTRISSLCFLMIALNTGRAQSSEDILNYINAFKDIAISEMQRTGVPASITLAQGIHETLAGTSELVRRSNNHFGIKCKEGWTGPVVYHDDDSRGECFRGYNSSLDSYRDHSDFLKNSARYSFLFKLDPADFEGWANGLSKAGYATNRKYAEIIIKLIEVYNLQQYSLVAMGKLKLPEDTDSYASQKDSPIAAAQISYPLDPFFINRSKVVFVRGGTSLLSVSDHYEIPLFRLLDFNEMGNQEDILEKDQLLFLQRKRRLGERAYHIVLRGEKIYDIGQAEGIRGESLMALNQLSKGEEPAAGEKLYLQYPAPAKPLIDGKN